jgi:RNA-directed DNA polymerase
MPHEANTAHDKTRELQTKLYQAAKRSPTRRFHALWDRIHRRDVLERAWKEVRANRGAPGVDAQTIDHIEETGVGAFVDELQAELKEERYRPLPVRRVRIPKRDGGQRKLGVPAVRDRVVQTAAKIVLSPIFEADFLDCSYGFRPGRSAHQAMDRVREEVNRGRCWAVKADVQSFFDELDHDRLQGFLKLRISDRRVLKLVSAWLRAGVWEGGVLSHPETGSPQGGSLSPVLANVYLHRLDLRWQQECWRLGVLVRYCDDLVVLCPTRERADAALRALAAILASLSLALSEGKVWIVDLGQKGQGFDFLGFHHRRVESFSRKGRYFCARWPSAQTVKVVKSRIRDLTARRLLLRPVGEIVWRVNGYLRGWRNYYARGNSTTIFHDLDRFVQGRVARFISKKHGHSGAGYGYLVLRRNDNLGLYRLVGTVLTGPAHAVR